MFSSPRFLAYINKPSVYYLRRLIPIETRKEILKQLDEVTRKQLVTKSNPIYKPAYELIKQERIAQVQKYEDSFLWSPEFTPTHFRYFVVIPFLFLSLLILYIHYVAVPRTMMEHKLRSGMRYPEMEKKGYLDGWYEEYIKKDKVLEYEMYSLGDLERLYKEGMLAKNPEETIEKIEKKKSKFVRGDRSFVINEFKTN